MTAFDHHHHHHYDQDSSDEKLPFCENETDNDDQDHDQQKKKNNNMKSESEDLLQSCSYLYPILFAILLILGSILLIVTLTRTPSCSTHQHQQWKEQSAGNAAFLSEHGIFHSDSVRTDLAASVSHCQSINGSSACLCPISTVPSETKREECLASSTRCLRTCQHNEHCHCYRLSHPRACYDVTQQWISKQWQILSVESLQFTKEFAPPLSWREELARLVDAELFFFSADQRTAAVLLPDQDDYLLNERWVKFEQNSTEEQLVYTQVDIRTRTCRLSSILTNGSINHHSIHPCPGPRLTGAPYYFAAACDHILLLWQGPPSWSAQIEEEHHVIHHHFQWQRPQLPVLLDPFHRYYSLYDDSMIELKNLNGDVLAQFFTDIDKPTRFEFSDQRGTLMVANRTHRQLFRSKNEQIWFDI